MESKFIVLPTNGHCFICLMDTDSNASQSNGNGSSSRGSEEVDLQLLIQFLETINYGDTSGTSAPLPSLPFHPSLKINENTKILATICGPCSTSTRSLIELLEEQRRLRVRICSHATALFGRISDDEPDSTHVQAFENKMNENFVSAVFAPFIHDIRTKLINGIPSFMQNGRVPPEVAVNGDGAAAAAPPSPPDSGAGALAFSISSLSLSDRDPVPVYASTSAEASATTSTRASSISEDVDVESNDASSNSSSSSSSSEEEEEEVDEDEVEKKAAVGAGASRTVAAAVSRRKTRKSGHPKKLKFYYQGKYADRYSSYEVGYEKRFRCNFPGCRYNCRSVTTVLEHFKDSHLAEVEAAAAAASFNYYNNT